MAAQFMGTKGADFRELREWIALATSSFPVPDSPVMRTVASVFATLRTTWNTFSISWEIPTIFLKSTFSESSSLSRLFSVERVETCSALRTTSFSSSRLNGLVT